MSRLRYGTGSLSVEVDDRTDQLVRAAVEKVAPGALQLIEREVREVFDNAKARWPVGPDKRYRTGHSRDMLGWDVVFDGTGLIRGRVYCTAEWSKYIAPKGLKGRYAFAEYLRKPMVAKTRPLVEALGHLVKSELEG
jgi:hypothetical protein